MDLANQSTFPLGKATEGENSACFTVSCSSAVTAQVVDAASGSVLAKREISPKLLAESKDFKLNFICDGDVQAELKISSADKADVTGVTLVPFLKELTWPVKQQLPSFNSPEKTLDYLDVTDFSRDEKLMVSCLKGLVNRVKPRIHTCEGNLHDATTWPKNIGLTLNEVTDPFALIEKYKDAVNGLIIIDSEQEATVNLATSAAAVKNALAVSAELADKLTAQFGFPVLEDYRGKFKDMFEVYNYLYDRYLPEMNHRILASLDPQAGGCLREYTVAVKAAVVWFDPRKVGEGEKDALNEFLKTIVPGGCCMGWWPEEGSGVDAASIYGLPTIPSDFAVNLTVYGGTDRTVNIKPLPEKPPLENKVYVALIMSDGDNLQYVEHRFKDLWDTEDRGSIPLGWTISPAMLDAAPGLFNWLYETATDNDCFVSGPSGLGYTYPNHWKNEEPLIDYLKRTEDYCARAGIRVITIWGHSVCSPTSENVGRLYARYTPSILGITGQETGGGWRIFDGTMPGLELTGSYCSEVGQVKGVIERDSKDFDGTKPIFLAVQPVPWSINVTDLKEMVKEFGPEYEFVRPDVFFMLYREAHGLPVDPAAK